MPGTGTGIESSLRTIGSSSIGSNQEGSSSPSGETGTTPASRTLPGGSGGGGAAAGEPHVAGVLGEAQGDATAETRPRHDHRLLVGPALDEIEGERVQLGQDGTVVQAGGLAEARQIDGDRAPAAGAELRQQRTPSVSRIAPAVQQHDAGAAAIDLEGARGVSCD